MLHGRLLLAARNMQLLLHASLDPYNTTEEMDFSFTEMELDWEEGVVKVSTGCPRKNVPIQLDLIENGEIFSGITCSVTNTYIIIFIKCGLL